MPPSTHSSAPVTKLLSSPPRNRAAAATSSGRPRRPSGISFVKASRMSAEIEANKAVSTGPGLTTLTRMPLGASSLASPGARERAHSRLARPVDAIAGGADHAGDRADQDDGPA